MAKRVTTDNKSPKSSPPAPTNKVAKEVTHGSPSEPVVSKLKTLLTKHKEESQESSAAAAASTSSVVSVAPSSSSLPAATQQKEQAQERVQDPITVKLKALYRAQDILPKLIEDKSVPEQRMDDYYVKLQIALDKGAGAGNKKQPIELGQIFDEIKEEGSGDNNKVMKASDKVLIVGGAGIGKTTLLHNICYQWGKASVKPQGNKEIKDRDAKEPTGNKPQGYIIHHILLHIIILDYYRVL